MPYSSLFDSAFRFLIQNEGGYSDDKDDMGGETNLGISTTFLNSIKRAYPEYKNINIKSITLDQSKEIYYRFFWKPNLFDKFKKDILAIKVFDICVNTGQYVSITLLQKSINNLIQNKKIIEDGIVGLQTLNALNDLEEKFVYIKFVELCINFYKKINNKKYINGWINRAKKNPTIQAYLWTKSVIL